MVPVSGAAARRRMGSSTHFAGSTACEADDVRLYWKVVLINGAVLLAATLLLVLGPVSVSRRTATSEALVLAGGLVVMLLANALLLRSSFRPVEKVVAEYDAMFERLEDERATSNAKALAAQEQERHRIAQELHDEVGQQLTVVLLGLKRLEQHTPPGLATDVALLRESAREGLNDVRRVARQLRPGVLDDLGLGERARGADQRLRRPQSGRHQAAGVAGAATAGSGCRARGLPRDPGGAHECRPPRRRAARSSSP